MQATRTPEKVAFASRRGVALVGVWHPARSDRAVLLCHGMESSKEGNKAVRLAEDFAARGCNALRFDFSYVGESEGRFEDLTISGEVEDLGGAWDFVRRRTGGPIGIVGSSLGGTVALLFAGQQAQVAAVATIAAVAVPGRRARSLSFAERERWKQEGVCELYGSRLRHTFLEDVERLDVPSVVTRIDCPLLVTHGTEDDVVPFVDAETIARYAGDRCELVAYPRADHRFSDPVLLDRLLNDIAAWMLHQLHATGERSCRLVSQVG